MSNVPEYRVDVKQMPSLSLFLFLFSQSQYDLLNHFL